MLTNEMDLINLAVSGDNNAMEALLYDVQNKIYNLSLRMLGSPHDAEDATQEINIKIIKGLSGFNKNSSFSTWVYRIGINTLINYKKSMFAKHPLSFEFYAEDINKGFIEIGQHLVNNVDENLLAEELKASCTNVMLQCMDAESRCIYILGTMFHLDSRVAGEVLDMSPEAYRQKLSRIRKKMAGFMNEYCGLGNGSCNCKKRIGYAIINHRLSPKHLEYTSLQKEETISADDFTMAMERLDDISLIFSNMPKYKNPNVAKEFIDQLIKQYHCVMK